MRYQPLLNILALFLYAGQSSARRRGGSGGGGGDDDDDYGDDYGDDYDDDIDGVPDLPDNSAPCGWWARQEAFGIPGLYYNGTLTIRHNMTDNTAWDDETGPLMECDNDDRAPKTYEYPAMILIAPTGNESDTNPMHWVLRGFQPSHQQAHPSDEVDFRQRWVYIRSSDFVVTNQTLIWDSPFSPYRTDYLADADATLYEQTTRVYWETNVSSTDGKAFSAHAEYTETPPFLDPDNDAYRNMASWSPGLYTSQYVTLSDVCSYNQVDVDDYWYDEQIEEIRNGAQHDLERRQEDDIWHASEPTVWLPIGATVEMEDIGADSMRWTLESSFTKVIPWRSSRKGGSCFNSDASEPFEFSNFAPYHSANNEGSDIIPWNISLTMSMSFVGSIIAENSTTLEAERDGKLIFGDNYERFIEKPVEDEVDAGVSSIRCPAWVALIVAVFCFNI